MDNDWTEWEARSAGSKVARAKLKNWPDFILQRYPNPLQEENYIAGLAADHYHRFREDFDIARALGHNAHRFSIEWSRIEPEKGQFDEAAIAHYREVIAALRARGMEPVVTLWHWTLPQWVVDAGGWDSEDTAGYLRRYCERVVEEYKDEVRLWVILNEPQYWVAHAYVKGVFPPAERNIVHALTAFLHLAEAHKSVYARLKSLYPDLQFGAVESMGWIEPAVGRWMLQWFRNFAFAFLVRRHIDFMGVNYYRSRRIGKKDAYGPHASDMGWDIYPQGLGGVLKSAARWIRKPIYVTENGIADAQDEKRAEFIRGHIVEIAKAKKEGIDIRGYFHWSLLDNFEWDSGFWPRFGLVEVDYRTKERIVRPSAEIYKKIIKSSDSEV